MQSLSKKLIVLLVMLLLSGCSFIKEKEADPNEKYEDMIELINAYDTFNETSDYFEISGEKVRNADGNFSFYLTIDKPRVAMYDVEVVAIEKGVDYSKNMAANVGVFEDSTYTMIPNQTNPDKGYYAGIVISGTTLNSECELYVLVQWKSKDLLNTKREYIKINIQ